MTSVRLPRLLDSNMNEVRRIRPLDGSLYLSLIPLSTATLTLTADEMIAVRDYVEMYNAYGSVGIFRARSAGNVYGTESSTVELEHAICEVGDFVCNTELNKSSPLNSAISEIFTFYKGSKWALGANNFTDNVVVDISYDNVLEAILGLLEQVPEYMLTFDFSTTPWRINVVQRGTVVSAEGRLGRNIQNASISYDDSEVCTRAYIEYESSGGKTTTVYYDADTISTYGVIEKHLSGSMYTQAQAQIVAQTYLKYHKQPKVAISITGYDFYQATGEQLDRLEIGKLYRLALAKYGVTVEENITGLNWGHLYSAPNDVEISLADVEDPVVAFVRKTQKSSGGTSKAVIKQHKEYWTKFDQTDYYLDLTAAKVDNNDNILQQAGMYIDATGVLQYADDNENQLYSRIKQTAGEVRTSLDNAVSDLHSSITQTAGEIRSEVSASSSEIYTSIQQTASGIRIDIANAKSGLRAYVDATAETFRQTYINETNRVWVQDTDPRNAGISPKVGDIWVESTHQGTWDGAEGFDWEHDEDYDWSQVQGAKIWAWQNDKWELVSDQQEVVTMTDVEQTSEHIIQRAIKAMTNDEGELSVYRAELEVKADQIRSEVNELIEGVGTSITQTAQQIRSEAHAAQSTIYSEIVQTASSINQRVAYKPIVFVQWEQPTSTEEHELVNGDLWIKTTKKRYWNNVNNLNWSELDNEFNWEAMKGSLVYVYQDGSWVIAMDEITLASDVDVEETNDHWQTTARSIDVLEGRATANEAQLKVTSKEIRSYVDNKTDGLGSSITQTAREIRSEVHAAKSTLYSEIKQTASNIVISVNNTKSDLYSKIEVTQDKITTSVSAAKSTLYTQIQQTASAIRIEARNAKSDYIARIKVTSDKIDSSVATAQSKLYTSIEQTASQIRIEARNAKSDYIARIKVTSDKIDSSVAAAKSTLYTSIEQTASQIRIEARNAKSDYYARIKVNSDAIDLKVSKNGVISSINQTSESITINASKINLNGYVKATDITSDLITTKLASAANVNAKKLTLTDNGYIVLPSGNGAINITGGTAADIIRGLKVVPSGDGYKLQAITYGEASWHDLPNSSFSRAVSSWVWGGGNGKINVTALPQNQTRPVSVSIDGQSTITSNGTYTYTVDYENMDGDDVSTDATKSVTVNVKPTKSQIGASRGSRQSYEPTADATLSGIVSNGWYVITVSVLGQTKTYKIEIDV